MTVTYTQGKDPRYDFTIDQPDFPTDRVLGEAGEVNVAHLMTVKSVEVKTKRYLDDKFYVEFEQDPGGRGDWKASGIHKDGGNEATHWAFTFPETELAMVVRTDILREAALRAYRVEANRKQETDGDNPTRGVLVSFTLLVQVAAEEPFRSHD